MNKSMSLVFERIGRYCGWLLLALAVIQFGVVIARYLFSVNYLWAQELALYLHGAIFMLGAGWTLLANKHVRIDVLTGRLSAVGNARVTRFGVVFLLLPMMGAVLFSSLGYVAESWSIFEGSPEVSGLPGRFLVKTLIPLFAVLMIIAGLVTWFRPFTHPHARRSAGRDV